MEFVETINNSGDLMQMLEECNGCVLYGAGLVGTSVLQYLAKEKMMSKIICIAVKSREKNPGSILGVPVYELNELESYKDKYLFLITTMEHLQENIASELKEFGCTWVAGVTNTYYTSIREQMYDLSPDIWNMVRKGIEKIYTSLICLIEEQNEISAVNTKAFMEYQNCYRGRDIVVVATGPTLNHYTPIEGAVHIGVNTVYKKQGIPLNYLFVQDGQPDFLEQGKFEGIENVKCKIFMGRVSKNSNFERIEFPEEYRLHENVTDYMIALKQARAGIYRDICHHPLYGGHTVTLSAFHFALYTYPKRIYLVGCDNAPTGYYDGTVDKKCLLKEKEAGLLKEDYLAMKQFAQMHYPETEIISINPVGLKGIFKDLYTVVL